MRIRIRCPNCNATTIVIDAWAEPKGGLYSEPGVEVSREEPRRAPEIRGERSLIAAAVAQLKEEDARTALHELLMVIPSESGEELRHWAVVIGTLLGKEPKLIGELIVKALEIRERVLALSGAELERLKPVLPEPRGIGTLRYRKRWREWWEREKRGREEGHPS